MNQGSALLPPYKKLVSPPIDEQRSLDNNHRVYRLTLSTRSGCSFNMNLKLALVVPLAILVSPASAGLIAYGICQTGCNTVVVACYAAAGFTFGTIAAPLAPPAIVACNGALGTCSAACALIALTPTP